MECVAFIGVMESVSLSYLQLTAHCPEIFCLRDVGSSWNKALGADGYPRLK